MTDEKMVFGTLSAIGFSMGAYCLWRAMGAPRSLAELSSGEGCPQCGASSCGCSQACAACGGTAPCGCQRMMTSGR